MRNDRPQTRKARSVVSMLAHGESLYRAATANYMTVQAARRLYYRWILDPKCAAQDAEIQRLRAEVAALSAEVLELRSGRRCIA